VFTVLPLAPNKRAKAAEDAKLGVRYASTNFTVGTTVSPLQCEPLYMLYSMNMAA
jgi:hypothetical protein